MKIKNGVLSTKTTISRDPVAQKKDAYFDIKYMYLQKIEYQRNKLKIRQKDGIENYKAFKMV